VVIEENVVGAFQKASEAPEISQGGMIEGMTFRKNPNVVAVLREDVEHSEDVVADGVGSRQAWG
jgi:hypothetical protein